VAETETKERRAFGTVTAAEILENSIRMIIREEISNMGLTIGHNAFQTDLDPADAEVKAWVDTDGNYERAVEGKRAPRGRKTVTLTKAEAAKLLKE
jgi:hypothetical protein